MKNWRKMTWLFLVIQILFIVWIVTGTSSATSSCNGLSGDELDLCQGATAVGAGIGIFLIIVLWALVDIILGVIWLVTNRGQRDCPTCGKSVKKGKTKCGSCGYDYQATA
jgi:hypothetical protein